MDAVQLIETTLSNALAAASAGPPRLAAAIRHAVFPGGARIRPRLCLAVHAACGGRDVAAAAAVAGAIEMLHCASLAHDDLPCFDDAATRRGAPSVHAAHGEALAVLAGDALIVCAFEMLARASMPAGTLASLTLLLARAAGMPHGIVAGQGWEAEERVPLAAYHQAKTAALFSLASQAGAAVAGLAPAPWQALGERLGEAYQMADDIRDMTLDAAYLGKPAGRDAALDRPNVARQYGLDGARTRLDALVAEAIAAIPDCPHAGSLQRLILAELQRLLPAEMLLRAA